MQKTTLLFFFLFYIHCFAQTDETNSITKTVQNTAVIATIQIIFGKIDNALPSCIPNTILTVANTSGFTSYQWYFGNTLIPSATTNSYRPTQSGYYHVTALKSSAGTTESSNDIPVSVCPLDTDHDGAHNNIDTDLDNDGITNDNEGGNFSINQTNPLLSSEYNATITGNGTLTGKPYYGFISEVPAGRASIMTYTMNFTKSETIVLQNIGVDFQGLQTVLPSERMNNEGDFIVRVPSDKTITILNPHNQIQIDTNFDGMYEDNVTEFTSFEIRFRYAYATPLPPGDYAFKLTSYLTNSITFIHKNLSDTNINRATLNFSRYYFSDFDLDDVPEYLDLDSDNDGIPDTIEAQGKNNKIYSGSDSNKNGLDDAFEPGLTPINSDNDFNPTTYYIKTDIKDLDSDNDGIYDVTESGSNAMDSDHNGIIDGNPAAFGPNGLHDSLETFPNSGVLNYTIADTDGDKVFNYIDLDSDGDSCNDASDAGFTDPNGDGIIGDNLLSMNYWGIVTSTIDGYTAPDSAYLTTAKIQISIQPTDQSGCEKQNAQFTIDTTPVDGYQWQFSTDGVIWTNLSDGIAYTGSTTSSLLVKNLTISMQNYQYRVVLSKNGNLCGLTSNTASLSILKIPILISPVSLIQCDIAAGAVSSFNLKEKNSFLSTNYNNELFTYYTSENGANTKDTTTLINNPIAYSSTSGTVWVRVENSNGCFSVGQLNLIVSATKIPDTFNRIFSVCDDYVDSTNDDKDGIATFDFNSVSNDLQSLLPSPASLYTIAYYKTENDALSEINEITNISNYRNTGSPNQQSIWVRIENTFDNSCYGLGEHITLQVRPLPNIEPSIEKLICANLSSFYTQLDAGIKDEIPTNDYTYIWKKDGIILTGKTAPTLDVNVEGLYAVEVITLSGCSKTRNIKVSSSNIAQINQITIEESDDFTSGTVTIDAIGPGSYEYSIDSPAGPFQTSNIFENIAFGVHEVYVNDKNGCGTISKSIGIVGSPKFFTPNADGYNDYWNVQGLNTDLNRNSIIYIYDRYGRLLKQLTPSDIGWDGTFTGNPLPADDYWYTAKFQNGKETKGHFSLKR